MRSPPRRASAAPDAVRNPLHHEFRVDALTRAVLLTGLITAIWPM